MELRDRLNRLGYFGSRSPSPATPRPRPVSPRPFAPDVADLLPGSLRADRGGNCFVAESTYPLDHLHADVPLSDLLGATRTTLALLANDPRLADQQIERLVLIDTETTGLAGGTGTLVFLIGLGFFADGAFRVEQFFLRDPSDERAMLGALTDRLRQFDAVVTFNGKCFDWPLIETRHAYNRVPLTPRAPPHLDLLFPARRLYRRRLGGCSLPELEAQALGMGQRRGDVPGWRIPTIYFDYLRARDGRPLVPVFEHNRRDILSMLALAVRMARLVDDPDCCDEPVDLYSVGRLFDDHQLGARAIPCYERALARCAPVDRTELLTRLAQGYRRLPATDRAVELWEAMVAAEAGSIYPYVELAKHLEHRRRDFTRAVQVARRAAGLHAATRPHTPPRRFAIERADLGKRIARLERRLSGRS